jgi:Raf kinase inhibitor-like YbhB/YbcL family protein
LRPISTEAPGAQWGEEVPMAFRLSSPAFADQAAIPERFTCEGDDVSPPLEWTDPPAGTRTYALIVDDPDAPDPAKPQRVWVHWVLYNLPVTTRMVPEDVTTSRLPPGTRTGVNDWGNADYGGPCPPIGRHRYFFKLHALDIELPDLKQPGKAALESVIEGHVLGQATLVGTYQKQR